MSSNSFGAALLTAAALTCLATAARAQGFISPGAQALSPPLRSASPAPVSTPIPQTSPSTAVRPLPSLSLPAQAPANEPGASPVQRAALPASRMVPQPPALSSAEASARLRAAVDAAWDRSPELAGASGRQAAAAARGRSADSFTPGPPSLGGGFVSDGIKNPRGGREAELSLATPLWLPGEGTASRRVADADLSRLTAQQQAQRLAVAGEVREALAAVALAHVDVAGAVSRLRDARSLEADVGRRLRAREAAEAELLTARLERMDAEIALGERQASLNGATLAFRTLTGVEPDPATLNEPEPPQPVAGSTGDRSHPRVIEADGAASAADANRRLAEIQTRESPEIGILARSSREIGSTQYDNRIGIQFRLPFSTNARNAPRQMAAQAELTEATATAANVRRQVDLQTARARVELDMARQVAGLARQRAAVYRQQRGLSEAAFRGGLVSLGDVIHVRALATEADVAQGRAEIAVRLARSRVNQSLGILP